MPTDLPSRLADAVGRLTAPEELTVAPPPDITGELGELWTWWQSRAEGRDLRAAWLDGPSGPTVEALDAGLAAADAAVDSGATVVVPRVVEPDVVVCRTVIALLTRKEASAVLGQPEGMPDRDWMDACSAIRDRLVAVVEHRGEPVRLLESLDAGSLAGAVGILVGAAARRTPVIVDGTAELAAALVADRIAYRAKAWWRLGSTSPDPGRTAAADRIDLARGLPLALTDESGRGAQATERLIRIVIDSPTQEA
jgi:nicotinate-nucleotide--dimethylbenzimidazole phosphoribosyltransferase